MPAARVIDVTGRLPSLQIELLGTVVAAAHRRRLDVLLIGAIARDFLTHHLWEVSLGRATRDIDLAIHASSWTEYDALKKALVGESAFTPTDTLHRLVYKTTNVDLVPFGSIAINGILTWPPDGQPTMSTLGLTEAFETALVFEHRTAPIWSLRVPTPAVFVCLKLIAWGERGHLNAKDAEDVHFVLDQASRVPALEMSLYDDHQQLLEMETFDTDRAISHLLGRQAAVQLQSATRESLREIIVPELDPARSKRLVTAMVQGERPGPPGEYQLGKALVRLQAFHRGLATPTR